MLCVNYASVWVLCLYVRVVQQTDNKYLLTKYLAWCLLKIDSLWRSRPIDFPTPCVLGIFFVTEDVACAMVEFLAST